MNRELEDFIYSLEKMDTPDLVSNGLDDVWLADLTDEELIAYIHEAISRIPMEEDEWYEEEPHLLEEEWSDDYDEPL